MEVDSYIKKHGSHPFGILPEILYMVDDIRLLLKYFRKLKH